MKRKTAATKLFARMFVDDPGLRRDTAFHEAGHVVAALAFGQRPHGVRIGPEDGPWGAGVWGGAGVSGATVSTATYTGDQSDEFCAAQALWVSIGGYVAQARASAKTFSGLLLELDGDEDPDVLGALKSVAWSLCRASHDNVVWAEVERRAAEVDAFLRDHWRHVDVIARRLLREGEITEDGLARTLAQLPHVESWPTRSRRPMPRRRGASRNRRAKP